MVATKANTNDRIWSQGCRKDDQCNDRCDRYRVAWRSALQWSDIRNIATIATTPATTMSTRAYGTTILATRATAPTTAT
eukprot:3884714-Lingulodinium_polyedra.AAC.1